MTAINLNQQQHLMLIKEKCNKLILQKIKLEMEMQIKQCFLLFKKEKFFTKNCESIKNLFLYIIIDDLKLK